MKTIVTDVYNLYNNFYKLPENSDIFSGRIPMMERCVNGKDVLILSIDDAKIVGFILLEKKDQFTYSNEATAVDIFYRRKGIAKKMLLLAHSHIHSLGAIIVSSGYSEDGFKYLKKIDEIAVYSYAK